MIRYYKLFDLLNRRNMQLSDLRSIISSATVAKLRKGEYISGEVIEKICILLECQPGDIMEVIEVIENVDEDIQLISKKHVPEEARNVIVEQQIFENYPHQVMDISESDELGYTNRCISSEEVI